MKRIVNASRSSDKLDPIDYDTFHDLPGVQSFQDVAELFRRIGFVTHGVYFSGRRARALSADPMVGDAEPSGNEEIGVCDGYSLSMRSFPRGAINALDHLSEHANIEATGLGVGRLRHFQPEGSCCNDMCVLSRGRVCPTCRLHTVNFGSPMLYRDSGHNACTSPALVVLRLRYVGNERSKSYDMISVILLFPQAAYQYEAIKVAFSSFRRYGECDPFCMSVMRTWASPSSALVFPNVHRPLRREHIELNIAAAVAIQRGADPSHMDDATNLARIAVIQAAPAGYETRCTSPDPTDSDVLESSVVIPRSLIDVAGQLIDGQPQSTERGSSTLRKRGTLKDINALPTAAQRPLAQRVQDGSDGRSALSRKIADAAIVASRDVIQSISLRSILALIEMPTTREFLPEYLTETDQFPMLLACAIRVAMKPVVFALCDERTVEQHLACEEIAMQFDEQWECRNGLLQIDRMLLESIESTKGRFPESHLLAMTPSGIPVYSVVGKRLRDWSNAALEMIVELFSPQSLHRTCGTQHATGESFTQCRVKRYAQSGNVPLPPRRATVDEAWPAAAASYSRMRDMLIEILHRVQTHACGTHRSTHATPSSTPPGTQPYLEDPFAGGWSTQPSSPKGGRFLSEALVFGGRTTFDSCRLHATLTAPEVKMTCQECKNEVPSIESFIPLPYRSCRACEAKLCIKCTTTRLIDMVDSWTCVNCMRAHDDVHSTGGLAGIFLE